MDTLTRKQVALAVQRDPLTVKRWEKKNILKPVSWINGRPLYSKADVHKLLTQGTTKP